MGNLERTLTYLLRLWVNGWAWLLAWLLWLGPFALALGGFAVWLLTQPLPVWSGGAQLRDPQPLPKTERRRWWQRPAREKRRADDEPRYQVR